MYEYITVLGNKKGSELERDRSEVYIESGEKIIGMEYLKKSLKLGLEIKDDYVIGEAIFSIGDFYREENQLDSALFYLNNAIEYAIKVDHKQLISDTYATIGESFILLHNNLLLSRPK